MTEDIIDEIVSLAATQIDAALDSGSSHMIYRSFGSK